MNNGNAAEVNRLLSSEYQQIHEVKGRNMKSLVQKFEATGSVADAPRSGRSLTATTEEMGDRILENLSRSPQKSTRRLSREFGINHVSIFKLLKQRRLKAYVPRLIHALHDGDSDKRVEFSELFLDMVEADETILDRVFWSDEACFKLNGQINRHNCVYWDSENPRVTVEEEVNLP